MPCLRFEQILTSRTDPNLAVHIVRRVISDEAMPPADRAWLIADDIAVEWRHLTVSVGGAAVVPGQENGPSGLMASLWFAALGRDDIQLFLNEPGKGSAGKAGVNPRPGGWNRIMITVADLASTIRSLRDKGAIFRGDVASGPGGSQILLEDPAGNVVELFERAAG